MNILWIVNIQLPEASLMMNEKPNPFGGWLVNLSQILAQNEDVNLHIAFPKKGLEDIEVLKGRRITYYTFSPIKVNDFNKIKYNKQFEKIIKNIQPDIIHIFGTEYPHTISMVNTANKLGVKTVISIQGLVSVIAKHYMSNIPNRIQNRFTLRDFIKQDNLRQQQKKFEIRGNFEIEAISKVKYVIGRTDWDKACTTQINPKINYYFCNEILRDEFYKHVWDLNKCEKYSIFVSQGQYPIKGLHYVLEAMPLILKEYPEAKLYIGGYDITKSDTLKEKIKISSYGKYIKELISKYEMHNKVIFTGLLDEKQICERYLKSNAFVCPSAIENSPNSLGEAMILGIPCVASYVGGIPNMLKDKEEGFLYQSDAPYMLAYYICEIFRNQELALKFSKNAREHALKTHDRGKNTKDLINIYNCIMSE